MHIYNDWSALWYVSNARFPQGSNMFPATHVYHADIQVCQILYGQVNIILIWWLNLGFVK